MKLRFVASTGVPVALGLVLAGPALATPPVSVRVEGPKNTLLPQTTVRAPSRGSIAKGGAPAGTCRANTAAGALNVATRHRWGGTYSSGLGIEVTSILGTTYTYSHGAYWGFYVNDRVASKGVCDTPLRRGEQLLFARVPDKGRMPLPIVVSAPRRVRAGRPFRVRTFVYTGKGDATKPVSGVRFNLARGGDVTARALSSHTSARGVTTFRPSGTGAISLVAVARGEIRSAPFTFTIAR